MESVILLGLMGVGFLMNKDKDDKHKVYSEVKPPIFEGSGNSIYDQANYLDAKKYEIGLVNDSHNEATEGDSKIIDALNMSGGRNTLKDTISVDDTIQSITGDKLSRDDFLINDQGIKIEPFFSGSGNPNINYDDNVNIQDVIIMIQYVIGNINNIDWLEEGDLNSDDIIDGCSSPGGKGSLISALAPKSNIISIEKTHTICTYHKNML